MFEKIEREHIEELHFTVDADAQLKSIIAIHNTSRGPALGGCRCVPYSNDEAAIEDVMRLAKGMSYKAALADLPQGGGKAVILRPPGNFDRKHLYRAFGRFVDKLGGRYITAVDSGTELADMDEVRKVTPCVSGCLQDGMNPSPLTALGVFAGIKAALQFQRGSDNLDTVHVAIQGVGNVGFELALLLHAAGARLTIADVDKARLKYCLRHVRAQVVGVEEIYALDCDVFAPCGLGAIINDNTVNQLRCNIVAGSANNQLASTHHGDALHQRGIVYAPDYVINAGGLIRVSLALHQVSDASIRRKTWQIKNTLQTIFDRSSQEGMPTASIADRMAEEILYGSTEANENSMVCLRISSEVS